MFDTYIMDCAVGAIEIQQDDGSLRGVEIIPEGCRPVSEDVCSSGYMAPADNVSFPENSLKQCCKCKEGESCPMCKDPDACTDKEKDDFVTNDNCFDKVLGPSPGPSPSDDKDEDEGINMYLIGGGLLLFFVIIVLIFLLSR
jgi:hypothetical protein